MKKKAKMGRRTNELKPRRRVNIMVSEDTFEGLKKMADGTVSNGVRAAYVIAQQTLREDTNDK